MNEVLYTKEEQPLMAATTLSINSNFLTDNQVRYFIHVLLTYTVVLSQPTTPQNKKRKRARTWLVVEEEHLFSEQKRITTDAVDQTPLLFILLLFFKQLVWFRCRALQGLFAFTRCFDSIQKHKFVKQKKIRDRELIFVY